MRQNANMHRLRRFLRSDIGHFSLELALWVPLIGVAAGLAMVY